MAIQKFTYYKDIAVSYKKSPPKALGSRMVFSRVHAGLRSYNGTVVQMRFLYTGASTVALICLIAIAYFYFMMYLGMRKREINVIAQVNEALINAKMESKIGRMTALLTAALICSFLPSIGITLLGTVHKYLTSFKLCDRPFLRRSRQKALRAQRKYITFDIYLRTTCRRKERAINFPLLSPKCCLVFRDICS